jgi:hypothetical protein
MLVSSIGILILFKNLTLDWLLLDIGQIEANELLRLGCVAGGNVLQLLGRMHDEHVGNGANAAVARRIRILVNVALVNGQVRKLRLNRLPVQLLTRATPGGGEVNENRCR